MGAAVTRRAPITEDTSRESGWWAFSVPENGDDPVAVAVFEQLDGVDAALEGRAVFGMARFVGGKDVHDVAEAFGGVVDATLKEAVLREERRRSLRYCSGVYGMTSAPLPVLLRRTGMRRASGTKRERKRFQSRGWLPGRR